MMSDLRKMYPNTPDPLMGQIMTEMLSQPLTVICFTSLSPEISVVNLLAELRGADMDPRKCKKGTLRRTLGDELGVDPIKIEGGKFTYIPNFIHVPMNSDEAYLCEQIFGPHFAP